MSLLKEISPQEATGIVAETYKTIQQAIGFVPNATQLFSASPAIFEIQTKNLGYFMTQKNLSFPLLAFIRLTVSKSHTCKYCINANTGMLMQMGFKIEDINAALEDITKTPLEEKEKQMLIFVMKVVENSNGVTADDLNKVRELGWSEAEIIEAVYHGTSQVSADMLINAFKVEDDIIQ
jgi:uncharacterized peroxidase-related enzyme